MPAITACTIQIRSKVSDGLKGTSRVADLPERPNKRDPLINTPCGVLRERSRIEDFMRRSYLLTAALSLLVASFSFADQSQKVVVPVNKTAANDGHGMYANYCATCHGMDGKGHGPAATAISPQPTDLTTLAKQNHGKYPDTHIVSVLQFGVEGHGQATMPVWGPILGTMNRTNFQEKQLRISNLARYLETIQER